eukprot:1666448-Rhodomonas_salina.1
MLTDALQKQQPLEPILRTSLLGGRAVARADSMLALSRALRDEVCIFFGHNMDAVVERELFLADCVPFLKYLFLRFGVALLVCESRWDKDLALLNGHDAKRVRQFEMQRALQRSCGTAVIL